MAEYTIDIDMTALDLHMLDDLTPFGLTSPSGADVRGYVRVSCADAVNEMAEEWMRVQRLVTRDVMADEVDEDPDPYEDDENENPTIEGRDG